MREKHATDLKTLVDEIHGLKQKIEKNKKLKKLKKKQKIPYGISVSVGLLIFLSDNVACLR